MTSHLLDNQDKILRDLECRFDLWLSKRKTARDNRVYVYNRPYVTTTTTTTTTATRECKRLSTTESTSSSSIPEEGMVQHGECEQDSAYFSEEDLDLDNLSSMIRPNIKKWQRDSDVAIGEREGAQANRPRKDRVHDEEDEEEDDNEEDDDEEEDDEEDEEDEDDDDFYEEEEEEDEEEDDDQDQEDHDQVNDDGDDDDDEEENYLRKKPSKDQQGHSSVPFYHPLAISNPPSGDVLDTPLVSVTNNLLVSTSNNPLVTIINNPVIPTTNASSPPNAPSSSDDVADIGGLGDPLQESRDVYKESVFGTYVASELMTLTESEARAAKIEILKLLNRYTTTSAAKTEAGSRNSASVEKIESGCFVQDRSMRLHKENTVRQKKMETLTLAQPSLGQPSLGQPSLGQPSLGQTSIGQPSFGQSSLAHSSFAYTFRDYDFEDIRHIPISTTVPRSWSSL